MVMQIYFSINDFKNKLDKVPIKPIIGQFD